MWRCRVSSPLTSALLATRKSGSSIRWIPFSRTFSSTAPTLSFQADQTPETKEQSLFKKYWTEAVAKHREYEQNLSWYRKTHLFMRQYGLIGYGTYWLLWSGCFGAFYGGIQAGLIDYADWHWLHLDTVEGWYVKGVEKVGMDPEAHPVTPQKRDILVSLAFSKMMKPLQLITTIAITPKISRTLGYAPEIPDEQKVRNQIWARVKEELKELNPNSKN